MILFFAVQNKMPKTALLENYAKKMHTSRYLVTIKRHPTLNVSEFVLRYTPFNELKTIKKTRTLLNHYAWITLLKSIYGEQTNTQSVSNKATILMNNQITTLEQTKITKLRAKFK